MKSLSIFFPAYNEEKNIEKSVLGAIEWLQKMNIVWEILIINDGSTDGTGKIAEKLAIKYSQVKVINQQNGGYGMAIRTGLKNAKYEWIAYTDVDGQFKFSDISNFFPLCNNADAICGHRLKRNDPIYRSIFSFCWGMSVRLLTGITLKDINCGFKMFRKSAIENMGPLTSTRGAVINPELALKLNKSGFKILEVGVNHYPRLHGKPTGASPVVVVKSYLELFQLWLKNS